ncbi:MAG: methyltransferase [Solirubrobacteraceae bacterium]
MEVLGRELRAAGLNELTLAQLFGPAWTSDDVPLVLDRYRSGDPRAALAKLFVLGERVARDALPLRAEMLAEAGLLEFHGDDVVARVRLTPFAGLLIAHDAEASRPDFVTGVNAASRTLNTLTVRRRVGRALDLGTGSGVEALLAAQHANHVVATDINPRALEYASLGARLNGLPLDLREGSLFEPVAGEKFDLIVANPPFVISPDTEFVYRDSNLEGDAICREVIRGAAAHLRPGGFATVLCNWICRAPDERWEPLAEWIEGLACDALLIAHGVVQPLQYAARWNEPLRPDPAVYAATVGRWLDYYEQKQIAGIGIGAVILRGRETPGSTHGFSASRPALGDATAHILRLLSAPDQLAQLRDDHDLLNARLALVPAHRLDQTLVYGDAYEIADITMSLAEGVGLIAEIEPAVLPMLFELTPDQTVRHAAAAAGIDATESLPTLRRLLELGFLESAGHVRS